jgi:hypothetical protein
MSYNGSGTFQINTSGQPVVAGTVISSTAFNALTADLATGLSTAITKDGQTTTTARIPFAAGISSTLTTDSSSTTTGSIITAGGVGIAKALYVGTTSNFAGAATFGSTITYGGVTLSAAVTGTGKMVLDTSPTLVTPVLGVATATSINKLTLTAPATSATLTVADGASLVTSGAYSLTLTTTALTNVTLPTTGTLATLAGAEALTNKTLTNPTVTNYVETLYAIGNSSTAVTIDLANGTVQTVTMTGNCTFTMPTATAGKSFILIVSSGAGSFAGTFTSVKWPSATAPTLTTTASRWDILTFVADGTNWYGNSAQAYA